MKREDIFESIDRQITAETFYRKKIKSVILEFKALQEQKRKKENIIEKIYRAKIRKDLKTLLEKKETVRYKSTGLNSLDDLFMNSNLLTTLETPYNSLTTSKEQRDDYKNHVLQSIIDLFKTVSPDSEEEGEVMSESLQRLFEEADIQVQVTDEELPEDKTVGPAARETEEEEESPRSDNAEAADEEGDFTGRNKAQSAVSKVEKSIMDYYDDLGNPADKSDFKTYLLANLRLYFDRWENALKNEVDPEFSDDVNKAVEDAEADIEAGEVDTGGEEAPAEDEDIDLDI
tara:strand:+ start:5075 stop:5938 length:864 start_codon:yes stop_codon:yes gene_type:complete